MYLCCFGQKYIKKNTQEILSLNIFLKDTLCSSNIFNSHTHFSNEAPYLVTSKDVEGIEVDSLIN